MPSARTAQLVFFLSLVTGCGGSGGVDAVTPTPQPQPSGTPADIAGSWVFNESFAVSAPQTSCSDRGLYAFTGIGASLTGSLRQVGTCILSGTRRTNSAVGELRDLSATGDSIRFSFRNPQNSITCTYRGQLSGTPMSTGSGAVSCSDGASGTWQSSKAPAQTPSMGQIALVQTGDLSSCAINRGGQMFCWGNNMYAQLATGDDVGRFVPVLAASGSSFTAISLSPAGSFACGLAADGTGYCWGSAQGGRLGNGTVSPSGVETSPRPVAGGLRFKAIAPGGDHTCALTLEGVAYCWGNNGRGQLGTGDTFDSSLPLQVKGGLTFASISAHVLATCGVTTQGAGYCWGDNRSGVLGNGTTADSHVPLRVAGDLQFSSITMGTWTACGLTAAGEAYCWGDNNYGQLGLGSAGGAVRTTPQLVTGNIAWRMIDAGVGIVCGVSTSNIGYCWGDNAWGQLGNGTEQNSSTPRALAGNLALRTISADWHACALDIQETVYCWGAGLEGSVGDGRLRDVNQPVRIGQ